MRALTIVAALSGFLAASATPAAAQPYGGPGRAVQCESRIDDGDRRQFCPMDTRRGVRIRQQLSRTPCVEGRTFFVTPRGVFVRRGCRAVFASLRGYGRPVYDRSGYDRDDRRDYDRRDDYAPPPPRPY